MLERCLASLRCQSIREGWALSVLVVENGPPLYGEALVRSVAGQHPATYLNEPELGIPQARNAGLRRALDEGFDWIGFVDDDEICPPDWLKQLLQARQPHIDIVHGPVGSLRLPAAAHDLDHLQLLRMASETSAAIVRRSHGVYTNNVIFRRGAVAGSSGYLLFDESLRFTGGSDVEFFRRVAQNGAQALWCADAHVIELVEHARGSFSWQFKRAWRVGANSARERMSGGHRMVRLLPKLFTRALVGSIGLLFYGVALFVPALRGFAMGRVRKLAWALGFIAFWWFGVIPQPYREIDGF